MVKRGCNQYLAMELDTESWKLNEAEIEEATRYDVYYAVITQQFGIEYRTGFCHLQKTMAD